MSSTEVISLREKLGVRTPQEIPEWVSFFLYGEPGVGKTYFAGTANDHEATSPALYLDVEGGVTTLRKRNDLEVIPVRSMKKLVEVQNDLYGAIELPYKCVIIDNMSELQSLDMGVIMQEAYNRNPDKVDIDVPSPREWGKSREHMRKITRAFRDLPCHVIFTAHVHEKVEEGQPTKYYPGFGGKARSDVPGLCDIVGLMTVEHTGNETRRRIQFVGSRRVLAKDRFQALGDSIINPSVPLIWEKLYNQEGS